MRTIRADLHNHLRTSSRMDGLFNPAIDRAAERLGSGGIFGLVNFSDHRYEDFAGQRGYERENFGNAVYVPEKDILVVKGQEVPTAKGHLLVLGLEEDNHLKEGRPVLDSIKEAKDANGIIVADHPFGKEGLGHFFVDEYNSHRDYFGLLNGWEVFNGEAALWFPGLTPKNANNAAHDIYESYRLEVKGIAAVTSSDGHSLRELGTSYMPLETSDDYDNIKSSNEISSVLRNCLGSTKFSGFFGRKNDSKLGALAHLADLAVLSGLSKIGIKI
ncbi:hypothetical protein J4402_03950 [Candidatus Pacearchaeota archaeon]|nr:hypothetical protein [Candidatus Pacearchaeota archaeon]